MNNDLKKVGLVFKTDGTVDFVKSLQSVNGSLRENYAQFKLVQTEWDNSTKASQKLKDKLDYLNNAYDLQSDKVNLLTRELKELENAEEKNEQAIQKKKTQLILAETKLESYKKQISETNAMLKTGTVNLVEYGKSIENAGKTIDNVGKKLQNFSLLAATGLVASTKTAIDFEDAFAGVKKTVDATDEEFEELRKGILKMSMELPATTTEISAVAEAAGQLGIQKENILDFTKTMIDLGESTNLTASEASDALARFANITNMSQKDFDKLGSTIVDLGNNFATTESEIVNMAMRIAGAGHTIGMSEADILSFATAISSVGIEAEMGGSAFSKMMINIESDLASNSKSLQKYAEISNMTVKEFKEAWEKDAAGAMAKFIEGLGKVEKNGGNLISTLSELGIEEVRLRDTILRAANASELFSDALVLGNKAWDENNALSNEAAKRYETLKSKIEIALNKVKSFAITLGDKLMPSVSRVLDKVGEWIDDFSKLSDEQVDLIVKIGLLVAAIGPCVRIIGNLTSAVGGTMTAIGTFTQAMKVSQGALTSTSASVNGLATIFSAITNPIGIACAAIVASIATIKIASDLAEKEISSKFKSMGDSASDFYSGIQSAESHLTSFNSTLFATNEEQEKLKQNMLEIQNGITEIAKRASDERRGYTQQEIQQLDEYFEQLRALKDQELQIQNEIAGAITQQATNIAENSKVSLEEYKVLAQEWIKTAQEQKDAQIEIINQRTIEEIALLNVRYGEKATLENAEYKREYELIMSQKEKAIATATEEVAKVNEVYAQGYTDRLMQDTDFMSKLKKANEEFKNAKQDHAEHLALIEDGIYLTQAQKNRDLMYENNLYNNEVKKIWQDVYKNMNDSQIAQLGEWIAMVSNTETYGGKISSETQEMVDMIVESYNSMPKKTKEAMKNAMEPMLDEMKKAEPSLYAKATTIANGILSKLKKAFDIHSPSRKMRAIFQNVMKGSELGLEDEEDNLYNQTEKIAKNVKENLEDVNPDISIPNADTQYNSYPNYIQGNYVIEIDYNKMTKSFIKALNSCRLSIDKEGMVKFIENVVYEVM